MLRTKLRKLLRRLILWAVGDPVGVVVVRANVNIPRREAEDIYMSGGTSRQFIVNSIKSAKINREL